MRIGSDGFISHSGTGSCHEHVPCNRLYVHVYTAFEYYRRAGHKYIIYIPLHDEPAFYWNANRPFVLGYSGITWMFNSKTTLLMLQFANPGFQFFNALVEVTATGPSYSDTLCL